MLLLRASARLKYWAIITGQILPTRATAFFLLIPKIGTVALVSPNGGENLEIGSMHDITWSSTNLSGNVKIEINGNYPTGNWEILYNNTSNDGTEQWTVTGEVGNNKRIRITSLDNTDIKAVSDANFSFIPTKSQIMEVPFYTQCNSQWCWAASTSMLLKYYGFNRKIWEIAADFDKGITERLNPYLSKLDSYLETYYGDGSGECWKIDPFWSINNFTESLISIINSGRPVIIFSDNLKHVFIVTGISGTDLNDLVYFHDSGTILADDGIAKGDQVNNSITWKNFKELINNGLSIDSDVSLCYVNSGHLQKSTGKLSFQINPSQIVFQNSIGLTGNEVRMIFLDWDGKEPYYGYKYVKSKPNYSWYPEIRI